MKKILYLGPLFIASFAFASFPVVPQTKVAAGSNVTVTKTGSTYTISASTGVAIDADGIRASSGTWSGENVVNNLIQNGNIIDVRAYGAVGDGDTDDAAAIQAAIDASAGKVVYLPAATYHIESGLTVTAEDTKIVGDGKDLTIIESNSASPIITISNDEPIIKGLTLYGTGVSTAGISIIGAGAKRGVFEDITIHHCSSTTGTGFYAEDNAWSMRLTRVKSTSNNRGIHLKKNYQNIVVEGCYFNDNTECQVYLSTNTGIVSFNGCLVEDEGYTPNTKGVIIETVKPVVFSNCYHESSSGENLIDFHITGAAQLGIEGMYAVGNDTCTNSIVIDGAASVTIKDSHFTEYVSTAIVNHNASAQYSIINCNIDKLGNIDSTSKNYGFGNQLYITPTGLRYDRPGTTSANLFVSTHTYMTIPSRLGIDTADGSDTSSLMILGAGATSGDYERAAIVQLYGNDHESTGYQGRLNLCAGNASGSNPGDGAVQINTSNAARVSILKDGKVGIGTTAPSDTLEVAGNIRNLGYGLATSSITFADGTIITSSSTLGGTATSIAADAITAGTMDADVIASSVAVGAIGPDQMQDGKNYNLSTASMTLSQLTLAGGGTATGITGDIPEISTVTYARINTIQFDDGTVINSSSTLGGTAESIAASAITAGTLGTDVIASSIAVASVQNEMITAVGADKINAGTLGASVIASSVAVNAVRTESIKDISLDATYLVLGGTTTAGTNAVRISKFFPSAITISTITVTCVGGTGGAFNIEERTSPGTAGTDVWSSDVTVSTTAWCGGAMGNDGIAANAALYLVPTSWNGAVTNVEIKGWATRD